MLITGGTGSSASRIEQVSKTDIGEIRIFSRDEKKQDDMRHEYQANILIISEDQIYIGDVRSLNLAGAWMVLTTFSMPQH